MTGGLVEDLDLLDLEDQLRPKCEVDETRSDGKKYYCYEPAVWVGRPPCGHEGMFCEQHHSDSRPFKCDRCGNITLLAVYEWTRI
jgi:hypothetical protein